jgi:protein-S-isoprenylcysteine O-methyltransferase Ste14
MEILQLFNKPNNRIQSYTFVGVQFVCLGLILTTGPWLAKTPGLLFLELFGGFLGVWAIWTMKLRNLSVLPDIKSDSPLQTGGPYRWIRHPMYTALLLLMLALVFEEFSYWRGLMWVVLLVDLFLKLRYEEVLLLKNFPEYAEYQTRTHKLIPWIV